MGETVVKKTLLFANILLGLFNSAVYSESTERFSMRNDEMNTSRMMYSKMKPQDQPFDQSIIESQIQKQKLQDSILSDSTVLVDSIKRPQTVQVPQSKVAGFTIDDTINYAELAHLAYINVGNPRDDKFSTIEKMQAEGNRVQFFGTEAENSGLVITHKDGRISVVYKGTNSARNVATDAWFNFAIDDETGLRCHNGIMKGFYRTKDQVFAILEQIAQSRGKTMIELLNDDVTGVGHSLGGGLTQMFMAYALKKYGATVKAVTFATPRIFDVATSEELDASYHNRYLNVMQVTDPVPGIALGIAGYKHFGTKLHIPYSKEDWQHKMSGYMNALKAMSFGPIKVGETSYSFEEKENLGIGKSKWIKGSSIPNPIYPLHAARESMARHVDPMIHKAVKSVKDTTLSWIDRAGSAVKETWDSFWN